MRFSKCRCFRLSTIIGAPQCVSREALKGPRLSQASDSLAMTVLGGRSPAAILARSWPRGASSTISAARRSGVDKNTTCPVGPGSLALTRAAQSPGAWCAHDRRRASRRPTAILDDTPRTGAHDAPCTHARPADTLPYSIWGTGICRTPGIAHPVRQRSQAPAILGCPAV
ncbi:hypothetical protein HYPSUDRAFT_826280 [Hypholoma sublateritium FD-334 SS-4]|uniref:Uncharacterized protein n=1 Tax=Hypholoma sublateritium (strain FD-334 SS-4) TaxID=945553 RepID=A0A0D2L0U9_HYPSF|nr:hypothetical protein HYPSUDRAFT_826280 [Hypholoma sublateritium FD-334 SS-4]